MGEERETEVGGWDDVYCVVLCCAVLGVMMMVRVVVCGGGVWWAVRRCDESSQEGCPSWPGLVLVVDHSRYW